MRAAWYDRAGAAAEVLDVGELPRPDPGAGEVRVRITYSGVNPGDTGQPWWQPSDGNIAQSVARGEQSDDKRRRGED